MKKSLLILSVALAMSACSPKQENTANDKTAASNVQAASPVAVATGKTYRVGVDYTYAPYGLRGQNGMEGLDVDIMNAIAQNQNFQVEYVPLTWATLVDTAKADKTISIVTDGLAADDLEDLPDFTLSQPYMRSGDCIYTAKPEHAQTWQKNKISVQAEDLLDEELTGEHKVSKNNLLHVKTLLLGLQNVVSGETQSVISDCGALRYVAKNPIFKDYRFTETKLPNSETPESADLGFGVRKDDAELLNKINTGLQNIKQNGELDKIIKKWS